MFSLLSFCLGKLVLGFSTNSITGGGSRFSHREPPPKKSIAEEKSTASQRVDRDIVFLEERVKELGVHINQLQAIKDLMQKALDNIKGR